MTYAHNRGKILRIVRLRKRKRKVKPMILEKIFDLAEATLMERTIRDVRIGLELMAVELDNGAIGVTYVLRNEVKHVCGSMEHSGNLIGTKAVDVAKLALTASSVLDKAMGLAVLNAVANFSQQQKIKLKNQTDAVFSVEIKEGEKIGVVGHIGPVIQRLQSHKDNMLIFERDESKNPNVYMEDREEELLPTCQVVFITSSTLINGTIEQVLTYCKNAREIVMVGSSTPLYPEAFEGTGVTVLAGTHWTSNHRDEILAGVSQCMGMKQLVRFGEKVSLAV